MTEARLRGDTAISSQDLSRLWKTYIFESSREKRKEMLSYIAQVSPELAHIAEGVDRHDDADTLFYGFLADFEKKRAAKPILSVSREEVVQWWNAYENKDEYTELASGAQAEFEQGATLLGKKARSEKFPVTSTELEVAEADIQYRRGVYEPDDMAGQQERSMANTRLRGVISSEKDGGKRAEYQFMWVLRELIEEAGLSHLIQVYHGTMRGDRRYGQDIILVFGSRKYNLDLKVFSSSEYTREHHDGLLAKARGKSGSSSVTEFDSLHFSEVVRLFQMYRSRAFDTMTDAEKSGLVRGLRKWTKTLSMAVPESGAKDAAVLLKQLRPSYAKEKKGPAKSGMSVEEIAPAVQKFCTVPVLKKYQQIWDKLELRDEGLDMNIEGVVTLKEVVEQLLVGALEQGYLSRISEKQIANPSEDVLAAMERYIDEFIVQ